MSEQSTVEFGTSWITVSEAAAALKISERTVQRKCKTGKLTARLETTETGAQWLIDGDKLPTGDDKLPTHSTRVPTGDANLSGAAAISADRLPTGDDNAVAVEIAKLQGYAARDMELAFGDAVRAAIAPLTAMIETMNETNAALQKEVAETRAEVVAMRGDRNADQAQLAKLEELISILEAPKPETLSTVEFDRTSSSAQDAPQAPIMDTTSKVSGNSGSGQQAQPRREPRPLWKLILGVR